jgi:hypothetical protein
MGANFMNFQDFRRRAAAWLAAGLTAVSLAACAEGARPDSMALTMGATPTISPTDPNYKAFRVAHVDGGGKTNPLWMSSVSSEDFQKALENSLRGVGYLADDPAAAKNEITANLQDLQRPLAGLDLTVTSRVHYSAKSTADQMVFFDDVVAASGTAKFGESLIAAQRLQLANEAAMRENIKAFIGRLRKAGGQVKTIDSAGAAPKASAISSAPAPASAPAAPQPASASTKPGAGCIRVVTDPSQSNC